MMTRLMSALLLSVSLLLTAGCGMLTKKKDQPKESPLIAGDVEETFRRRWLEKRTGELAAQGVEANAARAQAENEFRERFALPERKK